MRLPLNVQTPIIGSENVRVYRDSNRQIVSYRNVDDWAHPWRLAASYDYYRKQWIVRVRPGLINGYPPVIPVPVNEISARSEEGKKSKDFGINPLDGKPYFSSYIFEGPRPYEDKGAEASVVTKDIYITDEAQPFLVLSSFFNPLLPKIVGDPFSGAKAVAGTYPEFFRYNNVKDPIGVADINAALGNGGVTVGSYSDELRVKGTCELRSADVLLMADHYAVKSDSYLADPSTGSVRITTAAFSPSPSRFPYRLYTEPRYDPLADQQYPSIIDKLQGQLQEPEFDKLLIGRVWLISPPDWDPELEPDETWVPYCEHRVFWNLHYLQPNWVPAPVYDPITINIPLAAGLLTAIGNQFLAPLNQAQQDIVNALSGISAQGYFYTA